MLVRGSNGVRRRRTVADSARWPFHTLLGERPGQRGRLINGIIPRRKALCSRNSETKIMGSFFGGGKLRRVRGVRVVVALQLSVVGTSSCDHEFELLSNVEWRAGIFSAPEANEDVAPAAGANSLRKITPQRLPLSSRLI